MNTEMLKSWLNKYKQAWENRDPFAARELFTENATYQETPFEEPMSGLDEIYSYWEEVPKTQQMIKFESKILSVTDDTGIAHWTTSFVRIPGEVKVWLDGIFIVLLNHEGKCTEFKEWWHRKEK